MKKSKVVKTFAKTAPKPMLGIRGRIIATSYYTKSEIHEFNVPSWSKLNKKSLKNKRG